MFMRNRLRPFTRKLKTQLILSYIIIFIFGISICLIMVYQNTMQILLTQSEQLVTREFQRAEGNINSLLNELDSISSLVVEASLGSRISEIQTLPDSNRVDILRELFSNLSGIAHNYDHIHSIIISNNTGTDLIVTRRNTRIISSSEKSRLRKSYSIRSDYAGGASRTAAVRWASTMNILLDYGYWNDTSSGYYITAQRTVFPDSKREYTVSINLDERHFFSIYGGSSPDHDYRHVYLMDSVQTVFSGNESLETVSKADFGEQLMGDYGSFVRNSDGERSQVIYYRIKNQGWYLINEIDMDTYAKRYDSFRKILGYSFIIGILLAVSLSSYWLIRITKPLDQLAIKMRELGGGKLGISMESRTKNELGYLGNQFDKMSKNLYELMEQNRIAEMNKRNFEIEMLQTQINPHFIFNTLNTIKWMAEGSNYAIVESINALTGILRPVFRDRKLVNTIENEMQYAEDFIKIINIRFGEGITLLNEITDEISQCLLPNFTLQPLVENSVSHGFAQKSYIGEILVTGHRVGDIVELLVVDNGAGISVDKLAEINAILQNTLGDHTGSDQTGYYDHATTQSEDGASPADGNLPRKRMRGGIGCANIHSRIQLLYGEGYGLSIESNGNTGTTVIVRLPFVQGNDSETSTSGKIVDS